MGAWAVIGGLITIAIVVAAAIAAGLIASLDWAAKSGRKD